MRSSSAGWIVPSWFDVAMNSTLRQVDVDLEVVIAERVVLRRVEHLEQRRRRIALEAGADLVDLVEHEHRVHRARLLQRLHDAAGHRADVGAAMAADLRLVAHAAERDAHELAVHRARDRLAERRLADAGRADEAEDRPLHRERAALLRLQLPHRQVLDDAFLDLVEIVVILVEHLRAPRPDRGDPRSSSTTARRAPSRGRCGSSGTRATPASSARADRPRACATVCDRAPAASRRRCACAAPAPRASRLRRARPGSPSAAGAGSTAAARRSSPAAPPTRSCPSARAARSRGSAPSRPPRA